MAKTRTFSTLDIYLASFLALHGQDVILELRNRKVVFTFESTDNLYKLMNNYNNNESVEVPDYKTAIKTLRGKCSLQKRKLPTLEKDGTMVQHSIVKSIELAYVHQIPQYQDCMVARVNDVEQ